MNARRIISIFLFVFLLYCMTSCTSDADPSGFIQPPEFEKYSDLIGQPKDAVLAKLNLTEQDLIEITEGMYVTEKLRGEYLDSTFITALNFSLMSTENPLVGFSYQTGYRSMEEAIPYLYKLSQHITEEYGLCDEAKWPGADISGPHIFAEHTEESLFQLAGRTNGFQRNSWELHADGNSRFIMELAMECMDKEEETLVNVTLSYAVRGTDGRLPDEVTAPPS